MPLFSCTRAVDRITKQTEQFLEPNTGRRLEQSLNEKFHRKATRDQNEFELLGEVLVACGEDYGSESTFGKPCKDVLRHRVKPRSLWTNPERAWGKALRLPSTTPPSFLPADDCARLVTEASSNVCGTRCQVCWCKRSISVESGLRPDGAKTVAAMPSGPRCCPLCCANGLPCKQG